jgi:uncharacterized protein YndB with AHSA1/START domain
VDVDRTAPVVAGCEIEIAAPPERVWELLTDIDRWPEWNPDIDSAALDGPLAAGTTFRWKAGPGSIVSRIQHVEPPREIGWTGKTMGIAGVHVHRLEPTGGGTRVVTEESWVGFPVRLMRRRMRRTLERSLETGLRHLEAAAERAPS